MCGACLSRRGVLAVLAGAALAGCSENAATGRRQLVFVDDAQLAGMADQAWADIARRYPAVPDAAVQARLARIGRPLVAASGLTGLDWRFTVLDSPELNAFVLPNGRVGFFRGLLALTKDDDEVAAILGHEIGHIIARHPAERMSQEVATQVGVSLAARVLAGDAVQHVDEIGGALGMGATFGVLLPFSRNHELEADRIGVDLVKKAGGDPSAAVRFWTRMSARNDRGGKPLEMLSTHPADDRRLEALKAEVARLT